MFKKRFHAPIYAIYGFVRAADEIVDTFHDYDKAKLLQEFREDTFDAIKHGISLNPILNSFQLVVNQYSIENELIELFLNSMEMDLRKETYNERNYRRYILGSAEVVGLMCLRVFCEGDDKRYQELKEPAMKLGSAYQKINFLRDLHYDYSKLGRTYFPQLNGNEFTSKNKKQIERDIATDFHEGYQGIKQLPKSVRLGVYLSYIYYYALFKKIQRTSHEVILNRRVRINNFTKYLMLLNSTLKYKMNIF
jgi:phytoene/squalene synthetase